MISPALPLPEVSAAKRPDPCRERTRQPGRRPARAGRSRSASSSPPAPRGAQGAVVDAHLVDQGLKVLPIGLVTTDPEGSVVLLGVPVVCPARRLAAVTAAGRASRQRQVRPAVQGNAHAIGMDVAAVERAAAGGHKRLAAGADVPGADASRTSSLPTSTADAGTTRAPATTYPAEPSFAS